MKSSGIKFIKHLTKIEIPEPGEKNYKSSKDLKCLKPLIMFGLKPEFQEEIKRIRKIFNIETEEFDKPSEESDKKFISLQENTKLNNEVEKLIKKFDLSKNWRDYLMDYIITDYIIPVYDIDGLKLEVEIVDKNEKEYKLVLTKNTTLEEIIMAWPLIRKNMEKNNTRDKPWKKFWRDHDVYKMVEEGKTISEIGTLIHKKYGDELEHWNIRKIDSSFRKKVGIFEIPRKNKLVTKK